MDRFYISLVAAALFTATASAGDFTTVRKADTTLPTTVITDTPEGALSDASGSCHSFADSFGDIFDNPRLNGSVSQLVVTDKNVYIKDPVFIEKLGTWIAGDIVKAATAGDPDTVVVKVPQAMGEVADMMTFSKKAVYAQAFTYAKKSGKETITKSDEQQIKFTWDGDTLKQVGDAVLGFSYDDGKFIEGGNEYVFYKNTDTVTVLPANAPEPEKWVLTRVYKGGSQKQDVRVVRDGNDLYVGDLYPDDTDAWVKGTINGGKAEFKPQLVSIAKNYGYYYYFCPVKIDTIPVSTGGNNYEYTVENVLTYDYDAANSILSNPSPINFGISRGKDKFDTFESLTYISTTLALKRDEAYTPQAPVINRVVEYSDWDRYGIVEFNIPETDADGHPLDESKLYYKLYFDDKAYTFTKDTYTKLTEDMTEVPYTYSDNKYFNIRSNGERWVYVYDEAMGKASKVGVQTIYKGGNETRTSDITYYNLTSGIADNTAAQAEGATVGFTDLSGRSVAQPGAGVYIKTVRLSDGSLKSVKVVRK